LASHAGELNRAALYITIDVDVLDPAWCPGVNFPMGGGMDPGEVEAMLDWLLMLNVVAVDIVEYVPHRDPKRVALPVIARLLGMGGGRLREKAPLPLSGRCSELRRAPASAGAAPTNRDQAVLRGLSRRQLHPVDRSATGIALLGEAHGTL